MMTLSAPLPPSARRLMIIFNPTAGGAKKRRLNKTLQALQALGCSLVLRETQQRGDAERFAAEAALSAVDMVVAAGGDGTMNEVLNGLMQHPADQRLPLGIIPLGTANVLALEVGQRLTPADMARTLATGTPQTVHLALVQPAAGPARHVLLMASAGFDAHVVEHVRLGLKRRTGKLAYVFETLWQAVRYPFPRLQGYCDQQPFEAATVVVCNGRLYGGPFVAAPDGNLQSDELYLLALPRRGLLAVLGYAVSLASGSLSRRPEVTYRACHEVMLTAPVGAPVQADGDSIACLPVHITVAPETIALVYPGA
ncbi:diacylglycerol/lipid kinase family protein [Insolitispirillum peregrinum]|nr:diacylglycerol kinase family protein [Insolitispirillum peregrinum]